MKNLITTLILITVVPTFLIFIACENTTAPDINEIVEALEEIVLADSVIMIDGLDDEGAIDLEYSEGLEKAVGDTFPYDLFLVRFGKKFSGSLNKDVHIEVNGDTAIALITTTINAKFIIHLLDTTNSTVTVIDSVKKDFTITTKQNLKIAKFRNTGNPRKDWKVVAFTPILGRSDNCNLEITNIKLFYLDTTVMDISNDQNESLLDFYIGRDTFIHFKPNVRFDVLVTVENPTPFIYEPSELALVHYGLRRGLLKIRKPLLDPENDNTFTGKIKMHGHNSHMCRIYFDLIDLASIFDKNAPVNFTFWGLPYRVRRH